MEFKRVLTFGLVAVLVCYVSSSWATTHTREITKRDLLNLFNSVNLATARDPITVEGRRSVRAFLNERLSRVVSSAQSVDRNIDKYQFFIQTFQTKIIVDNQGNEKRVDDGSNYIVVFNGSNNSSSDEPLVILANYDTDDSETNPVDSNGSGVVALVALANLLARKINSGRLTLDRTVIFAATDIALYKYEHSGQNPPQGARSGAEAFVRDWLPEFIRYRKRFQGAIVLDSIMNFNDEPKSQTDSSADFSKGFPQAYSEMSYNGFRGNFLALVRRNDQLDDKLAKAFEKSWLISRAVANASIKPQLLEFSFADRNQNTKSELHFLKSEQAPFWNHFVDPRMRSQKLLPAILLTDTERYRYADCVHSGCTQASMTTEKNLEFLETNVNAVYNTIVELQTDGGLNGAGNIGFSTTLFIMWAVALMCLHF